jgi:sugar/nucleoside kinase (ribokinase family)
VGRPLAVVVGDVINDVVVRPLSEMAVGTDTPSLIEALPGGSGANQAAWLGALGARVRFVGRAGRADAAGHRAALESHGVEARIAVDEDTPTGTIVVLVGPEGERSMFTDRGASLGLCTADLPDGTLTGASILHLSGYALFSETPREAVRRLWAAAGKAGVPTSVDPSSVAGLAAVGPAAFLDWTTGASLALPNHDEGRLLTGVERPEGIVEALLEHYDTVALKLGPEGALVGTAAGRRIRLPAPAGTVVDTTGAGDAFAAGWLSARLAGGDLDSSAAAAVAAAARAAARVGARPPPRRPPATGALAG